VNIVKSRAKITFAVLFLFLARPIGFSLGSDVLFPAVQVEAVGSGVPCELVTNFISIVNGSRSYAISLYGSMDPSALDDPSEIEEALREADDLYGEGLRLWQEARCNESVVVFSMALQLYGETVEEVLDYEVEDDVYEETVKVLELKEEIERAMQLLDSLNSSSSQLKERGLDVEMVDEAIGEAMAQLGEAEALMEKTKFDEAEEVLSDAEELLEEIAELIESASEQVTVEKASQFLNSTKGRIRDLEGTILRLLEMSNVTVDVEDLFNATFRDLYTGLEEIEDDLEDWDFDDVLDDLLDDIDDVFDDIEEAYERLDKELEDSSEPLMELWELEAWMEALERAVDKIAGEGVNVQAPFWYLTEAREQVQEAYLALEAFDFESVDNYSDEIEELLDEVEDWLSEAFDDIDDGEDNDHDELEDVLGWLDEVESVIGWVLERTTELNASDAEDLELLVEEVEGLLIEVQGHIDYGDVERAKEALDYAEDIANEAKDIVEEWADAGEPTEDEDEPTEEPDDEAAEVAEWLTIVEAIVNRVEQALQLNASGVDITRVEELLENATAQLEVSRKHIDNEDWEAAEEALDEAEDLAQEAEEMITQSAQAQEELDGEDSDEVAEPEEDGTSIASAILKDLEQRVSDIEDDLDLLDDEEVDTSEIEEAMEWVSEAMEEAEQHISDEDYDAALEILEEVEPVVNDAEVILESLLAELSDSGDG
jgi:flagellin-specific chaperone FliS